MPDYLNGVKNYLFLALSIFVTFIVTSFLLMPSLSFAQEAIAIGIPEATGGIIDLIAANKGSKYGTAIVVVQGLMLLMNTSLSSLAGKYKLILVSFLSLASMGIIAYSTGGGFSAVIGDTAIVSALSVFLNQGYKQFVEKKD